MADTNASCAVSVPVTVYATSCPSGESRGSAASRSRVMSSRVSNRLSGGADTTDTAGPTGGGAGETTGAACARSMDCRTGPDSGRATTTAATERAAARTLDRSMRGTVRREAAHPARSARHPRRLRVVIEAPVRIRVVRLVRRYRELDRGAVRRPRHHVEACRKYILGSAMVLPDQAPHIAEPVSRQVQPERTLPEHYADPQRAGCGARRVPRERCDRVTGGEKGLGRLAQRVQLLSPYAVLARMQLSLSNDQRRLQPGRERRVRSWTGVQLLANEVLADAAEARRPDIHRWHAGIIARHEVQSVAALVVRDAECQLRREVPHAVVFARRVARPLHRVDERKGDERRDVGSLSELSLVQEHASLRDPRDTER